MKLTTLVPLVILVGAFVVGPTFIKEPTGHPIMQPKDWFPEPGQKAVESARPKLEVYKWTDENGVVQYSDAKPENLAEDAVETIEVAETMTMPKTAFTGEIPPEEPKASDPGVAILPHGSSFRRSGQRDAKGGEVEPLVLSTAPAMNEALLEIGQRFPQFKAMSDSMATGGAAPRGGPR